MSSASTKSMILIHDLSEIPEFESEAEEHAFWGSHAFSDELLEKVGDGDRSKLDLPPRAKTRSTSVTVRFDGDTVQRLRALAHEKKIGYQTLLKRFVTERLYEEEKLARRREGSDRPAR